MFDTEYFGLFVIITVGIIIGRIKIKGIALDSSAVIFVALIFGHYGVVVPYTFQNIGLLLFIYSIGIQAGPGFFESFRKKGRDMIVIAVLLVISGAITTIGAVYALDIDMKLAIGLFAGALTSTPGLASAIESTQSHLASIGYGIAYPFGVVGVIIFVHLVPRLLKINIKKEEAKYEEAIKEDYPELNFKHFEVNNENVIGKTLAELNIRSMTNANISRILQGRNTVIPKLDTCLQKGDIIRAVGTADALKKIKLLIGPESEKDIPLDNPSEVQWVIVTRQQVVNKSLSQLNLFNNYHATVTRIRRSGIDITPRPSSTLRFGDKLMVACGENMENVVGLFGNQRKKLSEADILPIAAGIVIGVLVGSIQIPLFGLSFKLGLTGGVLITALILSRMGKTGGIIWNVSGPANQLMRQMGLLFFLAAVGTHAGETLIETISENGSTLFIVGITITFLPMILSTIIARLFFNMNFLSLLGTLTGGMTSTPGLTAVGSLSESDAPNIAYATVYPLAMVVLIICTQLMGKL